MRSCYLPKGKLVVCVLLRAVPVVDSLAHLHAIDWRKVWEHVLLYNVMASKCLSHARVKDDDIVYIHILVSCLYVCYKLPRNIQYVVCGIYTR